MTLPRLSSLRGRALLVLLAGALGASCSSEPSGLRVDVDLASFVPASLSELRLTFEASPGGFRPDFGSFRQTGVTLSLGASATNEPPLEMRFTSPGFVFAKTFAFRLSTDNKAALGMSGHALAFDGDGALVAGADATTTLPAGGSATLDLTLAARSSPLRRETRVTDLSVTAADVTITGAGVATLPPSVASPACDVDGDGVDDLILGFPSAADARGIGAVGEVVAVLSRRSSGPNVDLAHSQQGDEFHVFGADGGDQLGTAVACTDVDGDGFGDILVGAPQAAGGKGRVYLILGRQSLAQTTIDLGSATSGADLQLVTSQDGAGLGNLISVRHGAGEKVAQLLVSAGGAHVVHLLRADALKGASTALEGLAHPTFAVASASANANVTSMALARLAGSGAALDVALGVPEARRRGEASKRGAVYLFHDVDSTAAAAYDVSDTAAAKAPTSVVWGSEDGAALGFALLAADTTGSGEDLFMGAPGQSDGAGTVYLLANDSEVFAVASLDADGLKYKRVSAWPGARFGAALAGITSGSAGGGTRLAVGAPGASLNLQGSGAVFVFEGGTSRAFPLWDQVQGAHAQDRLGSLVAGGKLVGGDQIGDLVAVAPGTGTGPALVYVSAGH